MRSPGLPTASAASYRLRHLAHHNSPRRSFAAAFGWRRTCPFSLWTSDIAVAAAVVRGRCKMAAMDWGDCAGGMARPNKLLGKRPNPSGDCSGRSRKLLGLPLFRTRKACARSFPRRFPSVVPHSANFARNPRNHATRRQRARRRGPRLPHCTAYSFSSLA